MINLEPFCSKRSDSREYLHAPWYVDGWVYATNGHVLVRVTPGLCAGAREKPNLVPDAPKMFKDWAGEGREGLEFRPLPSVADLLIKCPQCNGAGSLSAIRCPSCKGSKEGSFEHFGHWYECLNCRDSQVGPGWVVSTGGEGAELQCCDRCDGKGHDYTRQKNVAIGDAGYQPTYIHLLSALPDVLIAPGSPYNSTPCAPAVLTFTGGQALLMPRRP